MCGGVSYTVAGRLRDVYNCHCDRCRRFTGHFMAATAASPSNVSLDSTEFLRWYSAAEGVEYGFCSRCGSSLFWRTAAKPEHLSISAGSLDQPTELHTTRAWYTADMADYHERPSGLEEFDHEG